MAAALADALLDSSRSESEKLRRIREAFCQPKNEDALSRDEIAEVRNRLRGDRRLVKLSLAFANAARDADFAVEEMLGDSILSSQVVIARFTWLYTPQVLLNEQTFPALLTKLSDSAKLKVLFAIGKHLNDTELGDRLWALVSERHFAHFSNRLLAACSNELIIRQLTINKRIQLTDAQMLIILRKRFDSGLELLRQLLSLQRQRKLKQHLVTDESLNYVLLKDFAVGFDILKINEINMPLGAKRTRRLLRILLEPSFRGIKIISDIVVNYSKHLDHSSLKRYAPVELYLNCFIHNNKTFEAGSQANANKMLSWLNRLPNSEKRRFMDALFLDIYGKRVVDIPEKVFPEMLYFLSETDQIHVVMERLTMEEYGYARHTPKNEHKYFWIAMLPPAEAFLRLKKLLNSERRNEVRCLLYGLMLLSAIYKRDQDALEAHLAFVVERSRNEQSYFRTRLLGIITRFYDTTPHVKKELWSPLKELAETMLLMKEVSGRVFGQLFTVLRKIPVDDHDMIKDVAKVLAKCHLQVTGLAHLFLTHLRHMNNYVREIVLTTVLEEHEPALETNATNEYTQVPQVWKAYEAIYKLDVSVDFSKFPHSVVYLKYIVLPGEKSLRYMDLNQTIDIAFELVHHLLSAGEITRERTEKCEKQVFSLNEFKKRVAKTGDVSGVNLAHLLEDRIHCDSVFLRRVAELLAMTSMSPPDDYMTEALRLSGKDSHRNTAIKFLAMYMPVDEFRAHFAQFYPTDAKSKPGDCDAALYATQQALIEAIKVLDHASVGFEMLSKFMKGNYLKHTIGSFNYYCSNSPCNIVVSFLADKLDDCPVSARKHFLRWFFEYMPEDGEKIKELAESAKSGSIKLALLKAVYRNVENQGEAGWPSLVSCLDAVQLDDRQTFEFLFTNSTIDSALTEHLPDLFSRLLKFAQVEQSTSNFNAIYRRLRTNIARLPAEFTADIYRRSWTFDFKNLTHVRLYVESFVFDRFPQNLAVFRQQLEATLNVDDKRGVSNVHSIVDNICDNVVEAKSYGGSEFSPVLDILDGVLSNHVESFFAKVVHVRLMKVMFDLIPANFRDLKEGAYITEFSCRGIDVIDDLLKKYGSNLITLLSGHLGNIANSFSSRHFNYGSYMIRSYSNEMTLARKIILVHSLPYKQVSGKDHPDCQAILDSILQDRNTSINIVIAHLS